MHIFSVTSSERLSLSTTAVSNTANSTSSRTVLICADVGHFIRTASTTATVTNGSYFPPNFPYLLALAANETISAILGAGTGVMTVTTVKLSS